jgi:8-oxo-dGTP pyrophosphatase MutT (NUDIX family)
MSEITSLGVIGVKLIGNRFKFIVVKRRNTYEFIDFVCGRYRQNDETRLSEMFANMTQLERTHIAYLPYSALWKIVSLGRGERPAYGRQSFRTLRRSPLFRRLIGIRECKKDFDWDFPKGRRETSETELDAAKRELAEEAGCRDITWLDAPPLTYSFIGTDKRAYCYKYFFAYCNDGDRVFVDSTDPIQSFEVVAVSWMNIDELVAAMTDKKALVQRLDDRLGEILDLANNHLNWMFAAALASAAMNTPAGIAK